MSPDHPCAQLGQRVTHYRRAIEDATRALEADNPRVALAALRTVEAPALGMRFEANGQMARGAKPTTGKPRRRR